MTYKELIYKIARYRDKVNMSARELSLMIGKHEGYINKLECKDFILPSTVLLEIISAFGVTEEEFFSYDTFSPQDREMLNKYNKLSDVHKQTISDFIDKLSK